MRRVDDDPALLDEATLRDRFTHLNGVRTTRLDRGSDAYAIEVELCYIERELALRERRAAMHRAYLSQRFRQNDAQLTVH